jgi:hypothetical protein
MSGLGITEARKLEQRDALAGGVSGYLRAAAARPEEVEPVDSEHASAPTTPPRPGP